MAIVAVPMGDDDSPEALRIRTVCGMLTYLPLNTLNSATTTGRLRPPGRCGLGPSQRPEQYLAIRYTDRLADAGIEASVGSVGDSYDCDDAACCLLLVLGGLTLVTTDLVSWR